MRDLHNANIRLISMPAHQTAVIKVHDDVHENCRAATQRTAAALLQRLLACSSHERHHYDVCCSSNHIKESPTKQQPSLSNHRQKQPSWACAPKQHHHSRMQGLSTRAKVTTGSVNQSQGDNAHRSVAKSISSKKGWRMTSSAPSLAPRRSPGTLCSSFEMQSCMAQQCVRMEAC